MSYYNYNFAGSDLLREMGASWFVSYSYYKKIDPSHKNWSRVRTTKLRISKYQQGISYHELWLNEVLKMSSDGLGKNTIGLTSNEIKKMAQEILLLQSEKNICNQTFSDNKITKSSKNKSIDTDHYKRSLLSNIHDLEKQNHQLPEQFYTIFFIIGIPIIVVLCWLMLK